MINCRQYFGTKAKHMGISAVGTAIALLVSPAASAACQLPPRHSEAEMQAMDKTAWRQQVLSSLSYAACHFKEVSTDAERYRPAGDASFLGDTVNTYKRSLKFVQQRRSIPLADEFLSRNFREKTAAAFRDVYFYETLGTDIWMEDNCPHQKAGRYCVHGTRLTMLEASGKDGRAEMARIARDVRLPVVDPWFLIGPVDVGLDEEKEAEKRELMNERREAMDDYKHSKTRRDKARTALGSAKDARDERVAKLNRVPTELAKRISALKTSGNPDPAKVRENSSWKRFEDTLDKNDRRLKQIGKSIDHLRKTYPPNDRFAQDRITALEVERAKIEAASSSLLDQQHRLFAPKLSGDQQAELKRLTDRYDIERADADRRIAREDRRVAEAQRRADDADRQFQAAEAKWMAIDRKLKNWKDSHIAPVKSITSEDAEIRLVTSDIEKILASLNEQIKNLESGQKRLVVSRNDARNRMLKAAKLVDEKADDATVAHIASLLAQSGIDIAFAADDLRKASAAGPAGLLIEATRQIVFNVTMPPSFVEADRDWVNKTRKNSNKQPKKDPSWFEQYDVSGKIYDQSLKQSASEPLKVLLKALEASTIESALRDPAGQYQQVQAVLKNRGMSEAGELVEFLAKKQGAWDKAADDLAKMSLKKGAGEFLKRATREFAKGIAKSAAKKGMKSVLSALIEKQQFAEFLQAQNELALATGNFKQLSGRYWANEDLLELLRALRDPIRAGYNPAEGTLELRNEPFYTDEGYEFEIEFGEEVEDSDIDVKVTLNGIQLIRAGSFSVWKLPPNSEALFTHNMPEKLGMRIEFR